MEFVLELSKLAALAAQVAQLLNDALATAATLAQEKRDPSADELAALRAKRNAAVEAFKAYEA